MKSTKYSPKFKRKDGKMLKVQPIQLSFKRSQNEVFGSDKSSAQVYKSHDVQEHSGFRMYSLEHEPIVDKSIENNFGNNMNKKTAKHVSFSGLSISNAEKAAKTVAEAFPEGHNLSKIGWKLANSNTFNKFSDLAAKNQTRFEALFAILITCGMRPAAIGLQINDQNKEKNKKAISHSISSGLIGYGFACAVFNPIKKALDKVVKKPDKFAKGFENFATYGGTKLIKLSDRTTTFRSIFNYGSQIFTASIRSAITIAMIPIIDKYLLNKIFKTNYNPSSKSELKEDPTYKFAFINFKNNTRASKVFQNFSGVMK